MKMTFIGFTLAIFLFIGGAQAQPSPPSSDTDSAAAAGADSTEPSELPPNIPPDSALAQIVKLTQSGVDESVITSYVNNSGSPFNLTPDEIIYLKDLGLPSDVITAMIQRDQQLRQTGVAADAQPTQTISNSETETPPTTEPTEVTDNYFYDTLTPYGSWVNVDGYGLCWRPTVVVYNSTWQPYCDHGHWVYTDSGWYWISDYSWGSCTFHYGRWFHDPHRGWCWWPDTTWGPSWVSWRYSQDYCGWAPLPPHTIYRQGAGIVYNGAVVSAGFDFGISVNFFTFVPTRNFCDPHPARYRVGRTQVTQVFNRTTVINNFNVNSRSHTIVNFGIDPQHITAVTKVPIHQVAIRETTARGGRSEQIESGALIVNRPHFAAMSVSTLHQGVAPHPVRPIMLRPQNTPARPSPQNTPRPLIIYGNGNHAPSDVQNSPQNLPQPSINRNSQPEVPHVTAHNPEERAMTPTPNQIVTPSRSPQLGSPVQTPGQNDNYDRRVLPPKMQEQETPYAAAHNPEERGNATPSVPQAQNNSNVPHNESRSSPSEQAPVVQQNESSTPSSNSSVPQKSGKDKNQQ